MVTEGSSREKPRTADYLAPGGVVSDKSYYDSPAKMREFMDGYIKSIKDEGIESDPEKFAIERMESFLDDLEYGIREWRKIIAESSTEST